MSSYLVLAAVSELLRRTLWQAFEDDPVIEDIVTSESAIVFTNPTATARDSSNRLSLWLYQITENEFEKNQPPPRGNNHLAQPVSPLSLNLYYLLTPFAESAESDHLLLGRAMQALYDHPILRLEQDGGGVVAEEVNEELRIVLCRLTLEELTRIWEALREPYRLSVAYQVRVTHIDSERSSGSGRVLERQRNYGGAPTR